MPYDGLFRRREINVPRCSRCKQQHESQVKQSDKIIKFCAAFGAVLFLVGFILFIVDVTVRHGITGGRFIFAISVLPVLFTLFGAVVGLCLGLILTAVTRWATSPKGSKLARPLEGYSKIQDMLADGWQVGNVPARPPDTNFFLLSRDVEIKLGIDNILKAEDAAAVIAKRTDISTGLPEYDRKYRWRRKKGRAESPSGSEAQQESRPTFARRLGRRIARKRNAKRQARTS